MTGPKAPDLFLIVLFWTLDFFQFEPFYMNLILRVQVLNLYICRPLAFYFLINILFDKKNKIKLSLSFFKKLLEKIKFYL